MDELSLRVRTAAFRDILSTGRPVGVGELAEQTGAGEEEVRAAVQRLVDAGRARTDERGGVSASAGLSARATWHRIKTQHGARWTNCAYDARGILGALEADGEIASGSLQSGELILVRFEGGHPMGSDVVLFLADQSECSRPNEDWCPNVNLFEDEASAVQWAKAGAVAGRAVSLEEGTELGAPEWRPLVEGHAWAQSG
jgi:hypothetical protein